MSRPVEIISEMERLIEGSREFRAEGGPQRLEDWVREKASRADRLETGFAQPIIELILQKNAQDLAAVRRALVVVDPTHSALIGALQARAMWHETMPEWLLMTIQAAREERDQAGSLHQSAATDFVDQ